MKKHSFTTLLLAACACAALQIDGAFAQQQFSGRVYEGAKWTETKPISGVTVSLYGSKNSGQLENLIMSTTTNSIGWYGLTIRGTYELYIIVESDPSGYTSVDAASVSGTVLNSNQIQYPYPLTSKTLTGNKFWDQKPQAATNNPPVADAGGPYYGTVGQSITFDGSQSYDPDGDAITNYEWDLDGDGQYDDATGKTAQKTFNAAGSGKVGLRVTDSHNAQDTDDASYTVSQGTGTLSGEKFQDNDGDGLYDKGDSYYQGWKILLYKASDLTTPYSTATTGKNGEYTFTGVPTGSYVITEEARTGWTTTYPSSGKYSITLQAGQTVSSLDFGNQPPAQQDSLDHGDAPFPYPEASHPISNNVWIGFNTQGKPDAESVTQRDDHALGDDKNGDDDEGGFDIIGYPVAKGKLNGFDIDYVHNVAAEMKIWIDWNGDGIWDDSNELMKHIDDTWNGDVEMFVVPITAKVGKTFVRIRIHEANIPNQNLYLLPSGYDSSPGEVEDYEIEIVEDGAGLPPGGAIFGYKWGDLNGNCIRNPGEPYLADWDMWLDKNGNGVPDAQDSYTKTDLTGGFYFAGLADGNYSIGEIQKTGWMQTAPHGGLAKNFPVTAGSSQSGAYFGNVPIGPTKNLGIIQGMKFNDADGDGVKDQSEQGLPNWKIWLDLNNDGVEDPAPTDEYAITGQFGQFSFMNLPPGKGYKVREFPKSGWTQTYPGQPPYHSVTLQAGDVKNILFGNNGSDKTEYDYGDAPFPYPEAYNPISKNVWFGDPSDAPDAESVMQRDPNAMGDDKQGDDENGLRTPGPIIHKQPINVFDFAITFKSPKDPNLGCLSKIWLDVNGDGNWEEWNELLCSASWKSSYNGYFLLGKFNIAKIGKVFVRMRLHEIYYNKTFIYNDLTASGYDSIPGEVEDYEFETVETGDGIPLGSVVFGYKFNDLNGNGVFDSDEPPLPKWQMWLDTNGNGKQDTGDKVTQTDASGNFMFTGLADGTYTVGEVMQTGWMQTFPGGVGTQSVITKHDSSQLGILFGNRDMRMHGEGQGGLKWFQSPLRYTDIKEKSCFLGWGEPSMQGAGTLADNWFCYNPRPVTSIRWWGSYAGWDSIAPPGNGPTGFRIGVWTDEPVAKEGDFDRPKKMIREWVVMRNQAGETADGCHAMPEWKTNPDTCFQYTFYIPQQEWFFQEKDSTVYWLSIAAVYPEPPQEHVWGWLTRERNFLGDAVRIYAPAEAHPDSLYRIGERLPQYWDMAFVLGTDQNIGLMDFGDAPETYGTSVTRNGAHHLIRTGVLMGQTIDMDEDGRPDPSAIGDDNAGSDDEDGVQFLGDLVPGKTAQIAVSVSCRGHLNAWLDLNGNGEWNLRERIIDNVLLDAGNRVSEFAVPSDAKPGDSRARFRFSTWPDIWMRGFAPDGEVEDYRVVIQQPTGVDDRSAGNQPYQFRLFPNYPNPFNPKTTVQYVLAEPGRITLTVYDILGRQVYSFEEKNADTGAHSISWEGVDKRGIAMPSGLYIYRLEVRSMRDGRVKFSDAQKMLIIK